MRPWNLALLTVLLLCWAGVLFYLGERGLRTYLPGALAAGLIPALLVFPERRRLAVTLGTLSVYAPIFALFYLISKEGVTFEARSQIALAVVSVALVVLGFSTLIRLPSVRRALPWMIGAGITGALIAYFSSGKGGANPMLLWIMDHYHVTRAEAWQIVTLIRKAVHFCCYGTVAALTFKAALAATNSSSCLQRDELGDASPSPGSQEKVSRLAGTDEVDSTIDPHPVPFGHRPLPASQGEVSLSPSPREGEVAAERSEDDGGGLEPSSQNIPPSPSFHSGTPACKQGGEFRKSRTLWPAILFALLWTLPHAAFDEWRQAFEPNRGPSGRDVALDMLGALTFVLILAALHRRSRKPLQ